jgi:NADH dehydrogenase
MNVVVVGGGPTGVEVAGALGELKNHILPGDFPDLNFTDMQIYLVEGSDRLLNSMSIKSGQKAKQYLEQFGVKVILNQLVKAYEDDTVFINDELTIASETLIWAAGVKGNLVKGIGTESLVNSRVLVNEFNQVQGMPRVFALGDLAYMEGDPNYPEGHPMVAPVAIQQGNLLAKNFKKMLAEKPLKPFRYKDKGSMATIGRNRAVVDFPQGPHFSGLFAWLVWMFVHLMSLVGFRNKMVTLINWVWSYFTYDKGNRLIIRTFDKKKSKNPVTMH